MFADVADYSELRNGSNSTGLIFSSSSMAQKFGGALGGFLLLFLLGMSGYDKDLIEQAPGTLNTIKAMMSFVPAAGAGLGILFLVFYPLGPARMKDIQEKLKQLRGE
jgi:GPH family glycoside/pentoside/hexuronide:cation symporter